MKIKNDLKEKWDLILSLISTKFNNGEKLDIEKKKTNLNNVSFGSFFFLGLIGSEGMFSVGRCKADIF